MTQNGHISHAKRIALWGVAALLAATALSGCSGRRSPVSLRAEPSYINLVREQAFSNALHQRYLGLATRAYDRGAKDLSDFYALRAIMAMEGKLTAPQAAYDMGVNGAVAVEAEAARARLMRMMEYGVRAALPEEAAQAQAHYDCWMAETAFGARGEASWCQQVAMQAVAHLESAAGGAPRAGVVVAGAQTGRTRVHVEINTGGQAQSAGMRMAAPLSSEARLARMVEIGGVGAPVTTRSPSAPHIAQIGLGPAPAPMAAAPLDPASPLTRRVSEADAAPRLVATPRAVMRMDRSDLTFDLGDGAGVASYAAPIASTSIASYAAPTVSTPAVTAPMVDLGESRPAQHVMLPPVELAPGESVDLGLAAALATKTPEFTIYFDFDSDKVTPEADDVLLDAVSAFKTRGVRMVTLLGHTDSAGASRYNQLLALRRAQATRARLESLMGPSVMFVVAPLGEAKPAKGHADGLREALNRRVEILAE